jgi:ABC-type sugar transport system ATPase subunit
MLKVEHLKKNFGTVKALRDASFGMERGEIRALLGSNGSGKSTLVRVLSGLNRKDGGKICLDGVEVTVESPEKSFRLGFSMAWQDLSLISKLSVADNMVLGREPGGKIGNIRRAEVLAFAEKMIAGLGINAYPDTIVSRLDLSNRSLVEVGKALYRNPRVLILDEITASMHGDQVGRLFSCLNTLSERGLSILFVSHRLKEVYDFCRTATILREGESVRDIRLEDADEDELVYHMTGRQMESGFRNEPGGIPDRPLLQVVDLRTENALRGVSLDVKRGEIVGIAGLEGQGQREFLRVLYGAAGRWSGSILLDGRPLRLKSPSDAIRKGIGFVSGDRDREGVFAERSVSENIFIARSAMKKLLSLFNPKKLSKEAEDVIGRLNITAAGTGVPANSLSGGNQQKLVVGRWLIMKPRLLLLDDPTKGVDVKTRSEINAILRDMTKTGASVIFSSSDNEELLHIARRIFVFYEGKVFRELGGDRSDGQALTSAMLGMNGTGT